MLPSPLLPPAPPTCHVPCTTCQDDSKTLAQAGVSPSSRLLVTRGAADPGAAAVNAAAERAARLAAVRQAAEALAGRCGAGYRPYRRVGSMAGNW